MGQFSGLDKRLYFLDAVQGEVEVEAFYILPVFCVDDGADQEPAVVVLAELVGGDRVFALRFAERLVGHLDYLLVGNVGVECAQEVGVLQIGIGVEDDDLVFRGIVFFGDRGYSRHLLACTESGRVVELSLKVFQPLEVVEAGELPEGVKDLFEKLLLVLLERGGEKRAGLVRITVDRCAVASVGRVYLHTERAVLEVQKVFLDDSFAAFDLFLVVVSFSANFRETGIFQAFINLVEKVEAGVVVVSVAEELVENCVSDEGVFVCRHIVSYYLLKQI